MPTTTPSSGVSWSGQSTLCTMPSSSSYAGESSPVPLQRRAPEPPADGPARHHGDASCQTAEVGSFTHVCRCGLGLRRLLVILPDQPTRAGRWQVGWSVCRPTYLHVSQPDQPISLVRTELVGHRKGAVQRPTISSSSHWRAGQRCWGAAHGPEALAAPCRSTASSRSS